MSDTKENRPVVLDKEPNKKLHLNNFYFFLPGGMYRNKDYQKSNIHKKIIQTIDEIIAEKNISEKIEEAMDKMKEAASSASEIFKFLQGGKIKEAQKLEEHRKQLVQEAETVLRPLYERLLDKGFTHDQLVHGGNR